MTADVSSRVPTGPEYQLLELMYDAFAPAGEWPIFQWVSGRLWEERQIEARELFLALSERGLLTPPIARSHQFQLRPDTAVAVSVHGLTYLRAAADDLSRFLAVVRYIADRATRFRPASATQLERLTITSEEIRLQLGLEPGAPALARQRTLVRDQAWQLRTSFAEPASGGWMLDVDLERARRFADLHTVVEFLERCESDAPSATTAALPEPTQEVLSENRKVMVVHGRDLDARRDLFELLRALELEPIEWAEAIRATGNLAPYNAEAVEAAFRTAHVAIILLVAEEQVLLREDLRDSNDPADTVTAWQPRPNVFYEGGIAFTSHPNRTIMLELGRPRIASDLAGRNAVRIGPDPSWRHDLARRLGDAGCPIATDGSDWLTVGAFREPELDSPVDAT